MVPLLLLLAPADPALPAAVRPDAATMMARAREVVAGERCRYDSASTDITVCGLRLADLYRVPFVEHDAGDPHHEGVSAERRRLLARTTPIQELSPFLVGGGHVGVSTTVGSDGSVRAGGLRKLAP